MKMLVCWHVGDLHHTLLAFRSPIVRSYRSILSCLVCVYMVDCGCMFLSSSLTDCLLLNMEISEIRPAFAAFSGSELDAGF